jgi:hypothetical protein
MVALRHDYVLQRNCRVAFASKDSDTFTKLTYGSHHIRLMSHIAGLWNSMLAKEKGKAIGVKQLLPLPQLPIFDSGKTFGLVESNYTTSFKGLIKVKEEPEDEDIKHLPLLNDDNIQALMQRLKIDSSLLQLPSSSGASTSIHQSNAIPVSHQHDIIAISGSTSPVRSGVIVVSNENTVGVASNTALAKSMDPQQKRKAVNSSHSIGDGVIAKKSPD